MDEYNLSKNEIIKIFWNDLANVHTSYELYSL